MSFEEMASRAFGVTSFTTVGHLLHINLRDHLLQHKHEIGAALLKNNQRALAVVNKVNSIDNTFRNFDIEIIAKRDDCELSDEELMICDVKENKCRFRLDFSKVYWNSRLCTEHERIIGKLKPHDIVFDLFAGVGPFSVPAAKAGIKTYANDLNPEATKWLKVNMRLNKIRLDQFELFNKDAKDFILEDMRRRLVDVYRQVEEEELAIKPKIHILMNLPALAPTFLPNFVGLFNIDDDYNVAIYGLFKRLGLEHSIYCYCFLKGSYDDPHQQVKAMMEENLGRPLLQNQIVEIFRVRNVAPFKEMYRVEMKLDEKILFDTKDPVSIMKKATTNGQSSIVNGSAKKQVTLDASSKKRSRDDSSDDVSFMGGEENGSKRARVSDYCSIM